MKCRSVACIWSGTPPVHRVTATAVLNEPPTLYTGGSDGSIIWWNLSSTSDVNNEIKPMAMLCGHAAPIADLGICYPVALQGDGKIDHSNNDVVSSVSDNYGALISSCTDGVLCVWSRGSGHCRRRRKLPPWAGSPSMVRTVPSNPRYVCIGCCFVNAAHLLDHHSVDSIEGGEIVVDKDYKEAQPRKHSKCTVVIVDSYSLTIVQTVFHGNLSIGPLKFMDVVSLGGDMQKLSALMVDSLGGLQFVPLSKDLQPGGENAIDLHQGSSLSEMAAWADGLIEGGQVVSIATHGSFIALVLNYCCIFRLLTGDATVGKFSFGDNLVCAEGDSNQPYVMGAMFLRSSDVRNMSGTHEIFSENLAVWNNRGYAIVYCISYRNEMLNYEPLYEIPAASHPPDARLSISFIQLDGFLLRIESICFHVEEPLQWKTHITIWSQCQKHNHDGKLLQQCQILGESDYFADWVSNSTALNETEGPDSSKSSITSHESSVPSFKDVNNNIHAHESYGFPCKGQIVSSSMVISEIFFVPYAIVYGFFSGQIEVVRFDLLQGLNSHGKSAHHEADSHVSRQYFLGHTGAVLCLAAHRMLGSAKGWSFSQVLVSGSMDCTIRIWDLDTGNLITVMHQHVSPVRQIIFPPAQTKRPWSDCFLSVGEDSCVVLTSLETLRVERMFPGHPCYPEKVVWDGARGYIACLCRNQSGLSDAVDVLYIWDIKTGARERVLRGTASHSMFDHFCKGISINSISGTALNGNTSVSSLVLPILEDGSFSHSHLNYTEKGGTSSNMVSIMMNTTEPNTSQLHASKKDSAKPFPTTLSVLRSNKHLIKCSCPFPGIASLSFDLASLMFPSQKHDAMANGGEKKDNANVREKGIETASHHDISTDDVSDGQGTLTDSTEEHEWIRSLEEYLIRFSLSFLHLWNVDCELDKLLMTDMKIKRPENFIVASGLQGDKGSLTLTFPGLGAILEALKAPFQLWKLSSEFSAMRSLTMVALAQRMISLSHSSSAASSALAAFYTRNFADKIPDIKSPLLQLLVSFWQDESEHVRMAARSLFHCAASRSIPLPLCSQKASDHAKLVRSLSGIGEHENNISIVGGTSTNALDSDQDFLQAEESKIMSWLESYEVQDWISCVGGTSQDAMTSHIIVAAALSIWYPSLVKPSLAMLVVHPLIKLVMATNEKYSSTAAELLAEGMESTWKMCIVSEISHLIGDIFFQVECVSGPSANLGGQHVAVPPSILETLAGILLPSLAMADVLGFLTVIESQIWSTASDSPVHLVSLRILIRLVRGCPRNLVQYLDKVVNFILQTMDPGNSVMRKACLQSSMTALKEVVHMFPMVALNDTSTRLAVGDAVGEINNASIRIYDMQSVTKIKVLDASGPPGLPSLISGASENMVTTVISALRFSPNGEGLVAFSEHGLMIRWWSLGSVWWEKLSRNFVPVQCTKLIFVPPWEGFSPNSSRSSIMASIMGHDRQANLPENARSSSYADSVKPLIHNLDLSYRLVWVGERKVLLMRHYIDLGTFLL